MDILPFLFVCVDFKWLTQIIMIVSLSLFSSHNFFFAAESENLENESLVNVNLESNHGYIENYLKNWHS